MKKYKVISNYAGIIRDDGASIPFCINNSDYQEHLQWLADGNTPDIEESVVDPQIAIKLQERMELENEYLEASKLLCQLACDTIPDGVWPKLEAIEYKEKALIAEKHPNFTSRITETLLYCLFELKMMGWTWEQIEYRNDIVE